MCLKCFKKLSTSEAKGHFILIRRRFEHMFPNPPKKIVVRVKAKSYTVHYDKKRRIFPGGWKGFGREIRWIKGTTLEIEKISDKIYILRQ